LTIYVKLRPCTNCTLFSGADQLRGVLSLFDRLADAEKVFEFVNNHPEFIDENGRGYSAAFHEKIEDFLLQLGGEDHKVMLGFKEVVQWVSVLICKKEGSFLDLMCAVRNSEGIMAHAGREHQPFIELQTAQSNMSFLSGVFLTGVGGLDAVLGQFQSVIKHCTYAFDLEESELEMTFNDGKMGLKTLDHEALMDFEQRLGFVQHEERADQDAVAKYLLQLQQFRRELITMHELHVLGHQEWRQQVRKLTLKKMEQKDGADDGGIKVGELGDLKLTLEVWQERLIKASRDNKLWCFFSIETMQSMSKLVEEQSAYELALLLCPLFHRTKQEFQTLMNACQEAVNIPERQCLDSSTEWPDRATVFLNDVIEKTASNFISTSTSGDGPTRYTCNSSHAAVLRLILAIFGENAPAPYEILWCSKITSHRSLLAFMECVRQNPSRKFALLQVDLLTQAQQSTLLKLLLKARESHNALANLHCIETGPCALKSASWITPRIVEEVCGDVELGSGLQTWAFRDNSIKMGGVTCFQGPPGSGKTYQMRKQLASAYLEDVKCTVSITEECALTDIVFKLYAAVLQAVEEGGNLVFCFQINIGKFKHSERGGWDALMQRINKFFFDLLILHSVYDPSSGEVFNLPPGNKLSVLVEIPDRAGHLEEESGMDNCSGLDIELPVLAAVGKAFIASKSPFDISDEALHVAKYLKAFENGSIDNLFDAHATSADVCFLMDLTSSMSSHIANAKETVIEIARSIRTSFSSITIRFAFVGYRDVQDLIRFEELPFTSDETALKQFISRLIAAGGGDTPEDVAGGLQKCLELPWKAQNRCAILIADAPCHGRKFHTYDDNHPGGDPYGLDPLFQMQQLREKQIHFSLYYANNSTDTMGQLFSRNYAGTYENKVYEMKSKPLSDARSFQLNCIDTIKLTISEQVEKAGENITSAEAHRLIQKFMKPGKKHRHWSRLKQTYWIKYIFRRCGILASSEKFNKNKDLENFGSSTMTIMLDEVQHAMAEQTDWNSRNHEQFVYSKEFVDIVGEVVVDYKWSVLATNPDSDDTSWNARLKVLQSLQMQVPTKEDLARADRRVLDAYLANGLGIELNDKKMERSSSGGLFDFEIGTLPLIDENKFVLTLDFLMKMLCMNERIECRVPCIMEGETGVSKTALTRMLFALKNTRVHTASQLELAVREGDKSSQSRTQAAIELSILRKLADHWGVSGVESDGQAWHDPVVLSQRLCGAHHVKIVMALFGELEADPSLDPLDEINFDTLQNCSENESHASEFLLWFVRVHALEQKKKKTDWTFHPVDVHAALTPHQIANDPATGVVPVILRAERMVQLADLLDDQDYNSDRHRQTTLCIFFDEVNTSSCMGIFKEMLVDHSLNGESLPENIVIVAACNPSRDKIRLSGDRREELGQEWAIGHYQVHPLPASLHQLVWDYGSLKPDQEMEFIEKRLHLLESEGAIARSEIRATAALMSAAQQITRDFAQEHIKSLIEANGGGPVDAELAARASSSVSLRDILRVFKLYKFFSTAKAFTKKCSTPPQAHSYSILLSIAVVYYLRLGIDGNCDFRKKFRNRLRSACAQTIGSIEDVLAQSMNSLMSETLLESGIAKTRGLQENIFMVVVCTLARVPLMIVGPPGSSKTLAVTVVDDNARGLYSKTDFYKEHPSLVPFRYQCSRQSSSNDIEAVFESAIARQANEDKGEKKCSCFVFMDEAGLPEEGRESLKVLHYYLEEHTSKDASVGFVAITNHLLDAAKSNRCAMLTRAKPDLEELINIARGCLGSDKERSRICSTVNGVDQHGKNTILKVDPPPSDASQVGLLQLLCETYDSCMSGLPRDMAPHERPPEDFMLHFGLRDFMHFIKLLGRLAKDDNGNLSTKKVAQALQRSMNGVEPDKVAELLAFFMSPLRASEACLRNPLDLMCETLAEQARAASPIGRYPLVIDTSADDSVLRSVLEKIKDTGRPFKIMKLSHFPEDSTSQKINVISQVKWAAEKGEVVVLSQTEAINESFYDLFNQHFHKREEVTQSGAVEVIYFTNIAVGSHSRRCTVKPGFQCIVHLSLPELQLAPAPFLNRFEKYRLSHRDLLESHLRQSSLLQDVPIIGDLLRKQDLFQHVLGFVEVVGSRGFYGFAESQTVESGLFSLLSAWKSLGDVASSIKKHLDLAVFRSSIEGDLQGDAKALALITNLEEDAVQQISDMLKDSKGNSSEQRKAGRVLLAHCIVHELIAHLLLVVVPEQLFKHHSCLPGDLLQHYLSQKKHFGFENLLLSIIGGMVRKHIVFTRTSMLVLDSDRLLEAAGRTKCVYVAFSHLMTESQFVDHIRSFLATDGNGMDTAKVLLLVLDGTQTPTRQINFARHKVDELMSSCPDGLDKSIVFLVHVPASDIGVCPCYDATTTNDWNTTFLDGVAAHQATEWLALAAALPEVLAHGRRQHRRQFHLTMPASYVLPSTMPSSSVGIAHHSYP
jgi:hypothetical protein